ncbi:MAG: hypothetical protein P8Z67_06145 [Gammaproteobacteria bacterium]
MSDAAVLIGTCGWQYPQWNTSYYPEGLPADWRLAFYGNEYPVVLLPASYWSQGREAINSWLEETAERPEFICEWVFGAEGLGQDSLRDGIAELAERVLGIMVTLQAQPDATQLQEIARLAADYPVCLDWPEAEPGQLHALLSQAGLAKTVGICWRGEAENVAQLESGRLLVARVPSEGQTPRSLRSLLETLITNAGDRQVVVLFDGNPPDLEIVDQAEVIVNLL